MLLRLHAAPARSTANPTARIVRSFIVQTSLAAGAYRNATTMRRCDVNADARIATALHTDTIVLQSHMTWPKTTPTMPGATAPDHTSQRRDPTRTQDPRRRD